METADVIPQLMLEWTTAEVNLRERDGVKCSILCLERVLSHLNYSKRTVAVPSVVFHELFLGFFLPDVNDAATALLDITAAVSRSAADTVLMSKLISCEQREMT